MNIFITGGAGFIGSALIRHILTQGADRVLNLDKLSYASNLDSLASVAGNTHYEFVQGDIADRPLVDACLNRFQPDVIIHLAAETHVDRSIDINRHQLQGRAQALAHSHYGQYLLKLAQEAPTPWDTAL